MPAILDSRPKTYKKPTIDDIDPVTNYIPALVRDRVSQECIEMCSKLRKFVIYNCKPREEQYLNSEPKSEERERIIQELLESKKDYDLIFFFDNDNDADYGNSACIDRLPKFNYLEYGILYQFVGKSILASKVISFCGGNTYSKSINNMSALELFLHYGDNNQKTEFAIPMINKKRDVEFFISEKDVASSDILNINTNCNLDFKTNKMIINGKKWFIPDILKLNGGNPNNNNNSGCYYAEAYWIILAVTEHDENNIYKKHSLVMVDTQNIIDKLNDGKEISISRITTDDSCLFGDSCYYEVEFNNLEVPLCVLGGRGDGFHVLQEKSSLVKIYECMKLVGMGEEALQRANERASQRKVYGSKLQKSEHFKFELAKHKISLQNCRLQLCNAAVKLQIEGFKAAKQEIAISKIVTPQTVCHVIDWAMQIFGCSSFTKNNPLWEMYNNARADRVNETPDEALLSQLGKNEILLMNKVLNLHIEENSTRCTNGIGRKKR
ncbi:uncharacterized protein SCODWIG_02148 [Saccharomycodes ludwigii]|uniref:Acyl-CoA dehydrogenase/oxidase C-terminal domain-containing protein n=1 Tax=Saccharomycodes ludwigii TaxID=36035 RepID=A0A376B6Q3_9ASCO|nr:conserved putative acyl-CoA dehydrogenase [Saccharomycodes ludwigii]KAH3900973.1 conserved putative acyl-CoA dehydrogenase [Saccharomycodes ludwigii]SSD60387.1 uncharacterized protein SCODWIG_02148 [Saccharomycodes ludwigii]